MVNKENVQKLVEAAVTGMEVVMGIEPPGTFSSEDVVNAGVNIAARAINFAITSGGSDEQNSINKLACRASLQQLMLLTSDNLKVF
jgi:hypothetical protein